MPKPYRPANPLIWGAATGLIAAVIVAIPSGSISPNVLLQDPLKAGFAGVGFGVLIAMFRNWFNERNHAPRQ